MLDWFHVQISTDLSNRCMAFITYVAKCNLPYHYLHKKKIYFQTSQFLGCNRAFLFTEFKCIFILNLIGFYVRATLVIGNAISCINLNVEFVDNLNELFVSWKYLYFLVLWYKIKQFCWLLGVEGIAPWLNPEQCWIMNSINKYRVK